MSAAEALEREEVFDALGNPVRRELMRLLAPGPRPVGELAASLPVSRPAVSKHLRILEDAGLVAHDKQGTRSVFRLHPAGFEAARQWLDGFWDDALARFTEDGEHTLVEVTHSEGQSQLGEA